MSAIKPFALLLLACLFSCLSLPAQAHWADMAALELDLDLGQAQAQLALPAPFLQPWDRDHDGSLSPAEISAQQAAITAFLAQHVQLLIDREPARLQLQPMNQNQLNQPGQVGLNLSWSWTGQARQAELSYDLFPADAPQAHCLVSVHQPGADQASSSLVFDRGHTRQPLTRPALVDQIGQFGLLGLEHILTGYDHLLFLFALLLTSRRLGYLLKIVTAFTLAHSLTLSLAVLGWVHLPSRWIESLIAVSILYVVCVEVLWKRKETSWMVVFGFGLIHGLGFASILQEMALPTQQLVTALLSFNLGIESGQMLMVLLFWSLTAAGAAAVRTLQRSQQKPLHQQWQQQWQQHWPQHLQTACALAILVTAAYWLIERVNS